MTAQASDPRAERRKARLRTLWLAGLDVSTITAQVGGPPPSVAFDLLGLTDADIVAGVRQRLKDISERSS